MATRLAPRRWWRGLSSGIRDCGWPRP
jgi:hypothetical protein